MLGIELTPEHPVSRVGELGALAEGAGFGAAFVSHHYNNRDEFITLAEIAARTDTIALGPGVVNPYETHPVTLASRMATLDEFADGRGILGLGAGDRTTLANLGIDRARPLRRVLETIRVTRRLMNGERVDHDGTFEAVDAGLNYDAGPVPTYVGAQGPDMLRMGAKHADGVLFNGSHPRDVEWAAERVAEGRTARGKGGDPTDGDDRGEQSGDAEDGEAANDAEEAAFVVYASVSVARDGDAAREAARPPVAFIAAGAPDQVLERHGIDRDVATAIADSVAAGEFTVAFEAVTPAMLDAFCVAGTPETVGERLGRIAAVADGVVVGSPLGPDSETAIDLAGTLARDLPV
ncbi:MAG: 5,10-methylenetetrahydromethanopterin reductase [Haloarculaceae archaeon]